MAVPVVASFEFAVSGGGGSATEVTVNKPSGVASGDLLILLVGNEDNTNSTSFANKTGWQKEYEFGNATPDTKIAMYWRVADGTEAASETIDWSATGGDYGGAWYLRVTGADPTTPIHLLGSSSQTSGATSQAASSITPTIDDTLVFAHHSFDGADGTHGVSGTNWPSAFPTNQFIFDSAGTATAWCGGWVTQDLASAGVSNNCTFTSNLSDGMVQVQFAVAPASGGAGTDALLADDVASSSSVTNPAVGQIHVLNAGDVASASSVTAPTLGQIHDLAADDVSSASSVTEPALTLITLLLADDVSSASSVTAPTLGQIHDLAAEDVASASAVTAPSIAVISLRRRLPVRRLGRNMFYRRMMYLPRHPLLVRRLGLRACMKPRVGVRAAEVGARQRASRFYKSGLRRGSKNRSLSRSRLGKSGNDRDRSQLNFL